MIDKTYTNTKKQQPNSTLIRRGADRYKRRYIRSGLLCLSVKTAIERSLSKPNPMFYSEDKTLSNAAADGIAGRKNEERYGKFNKLKNKQTDNKKR